MCPTSIDSLPITITRCELGVIVDAHERDAALVDRLRRAVVRAGVGCHRQLPGRIYVYCERGKAAELAERVRRWLVAAGCEVSLGDW